MKTKKKHNQVRSISRASKLDLFGMLLVIVTFVLWVLSSVVWPLISNRIMFSWIRQLIVGLSTICSSILLLIFPNVILHWFVRTMNHLTNIVLRLLRVSDIAAAGVPENAPNGLRLVATILIIIAILRIVSVVSQIIDRPECLIEICQSVH
jgi:hypothetical protein